MAGPAPVTLLTLAHTQAGPPGLKRHAQGQSDFKADAWDARDLEGHFSAPVA